MNYVQLLDRLTVAHDQLHSGGYLASDDWWAHEQAHHGRAWGHRHRPDPGGLYAHGGWPVPA